MAHKKQAIFDKFQEKIFKTLDTYRRKWTNKKNLMKGVEHMPFILQVQDGINNLFEMGYCKHQTQDIIKECFKKSLEYQKSRFN
jgi:hypothetical protein